MSKKYFWLKLKDNFFHDIKIKKLRKIAGGDTYTIIYQKILLLSISNGGVIKFEGVEDTLAEELSLILDESETNVDMTLAYMSKYNLIEQIHDDEFLLIDAPLLIGSESDSAERVRKLRAKKKQDSLIEPNTDQKALQCNDGVTQRREEKENIREKKTNAYDDFLSEIKSKVKHKSKVTKTKEGANLFKQIVNPQEVIEAYIKHQLDKGEFSIRITAFMLDRDAYIQQPKQIMSAGTLSAEALANQQRIIENMNR